VADGFISRVKCEDAIYFANKWLTRDLYRSLAFEGDRLTRMRVQTAVENLKNSAKSK
jgi:hypothetical protein